ncbi:aldehyde dehydrogenase [Tsukamurella sp. NPDC003166]|uniref:aldehyde dehydrogenase n=1 Tax=Tsukamurella sp. NPDC003166 TaxID=3154444 RepID=UPI0033B717AB
MTSTYIDHLYIGGEFRPAHSAGRIELTDPRTEEVFGAVPDGDATDVDAAVRAADAAGPGWAATAPSERARLLRALSDAFAERADTISSLIVQENGTPISIASAMQAMVVQNYRYFADLADALQTEEARASQTGDVIISRVPVGVVAAIIPWNGPQPLTAWKIGPALAAGCTVVIKPAPETTLDAMVLAEAAQAAGFPPGVVNVISGGRQTGADLVAHPAVRKVSFTGSTAAGRAIAAQCGADLKRVTLELGGKSAAIVLDDADLAAFAPFVRSACTPNTGQTCRALTRVLAPESRYDEVVDVITKTMVDSPIGDPRDASVFYGPLVNAAQFEKVLGYLEVGKAEGATVALGGGRDTRFERGYYVEPTVFRDVNNDMRIAREEIFGPVVVVIPYGTVDEAVAIANDSDYGLGGGVFSTDKDRATEVARRVVSGTVGVNSASFPMDAPFGGVKASGIGRELGPGALDAYLDTKTIFRS